MNKIERKKLILIIAVIAVVAAAGIVIALSMLTGQYKEDTPSENPQPTETEQIEAPIDGDEVIPAPVAAPGDNEVPPADAFANDYSDDEGYTALPEGFDGSNPATSVGTVHDLAWASVRTDILLCELSNKQTITEKALQPITDFRKDLSQVEGPEADSLQATVNQYLTKWKERIGERSPGSDRSELAMYCLMIESEE